MREFSLVAMIIGNPAHSFYFTLENQQGNEVSMDKEHIKILLIEEDEDDYALVRELLSEVKHVNFSLDWVKTYRKGLKELCRANHDACVLDYRLGSRNGLELLSEALVAGCDNPIIFLAGQGDYGADIRAMRSGAADYLIKAQLTSDVLDRSIRYSIARKGAERELRGCHDRLEDLVKKWSEQLDATNQKLRVKISECENAEAALRENMERLRLAQIGANVGIWDWNPRTGEHNRTPELNLLYGTDQETIKTYCDWRERVHPDDIERFEAERDNAIAKREPFDQEFRFFHSSGEVRWMSVRGRAVYNREGEAVGVLGVNIDITERKREQIELFNSRQMLRSVLDNIPQRVFWKDINSVYLGCNEPFAVDCGYEDPSEVVGKNDYQTASAANADLYRSDDRKVMETGRAKLRFEEPQIKPDGTRAWVNTSKVPMYDNDGQVYGVLGTYEDITQRKRAEDRLKEYEKVVESLEEMIAVVDRDYRYLIANRAFLNYRGMESGQVVGRLVEEVLGKEVFEKVIKKQLDECFQGNDIKYEMKYNYPKYGDRDLFVSYFPIEGPVGVNRAACVLQDITERKHIEEMLRKSRDELELRVKERTTALEKANEVLQQIPSKLIAAQEEERKRLASELHDSIGQTLVAIKLSVELALLAKSEENLKEAFEKLQDVVPTIQNAIKEIRNIYTGLRPTMLDNLGLISTLQWLCREWMKLYPDRHIELRTGVAEKGIPEKLKVNIFRITQEALNNIAKHSQAGWVDISLSKHKDGIVLTVSDDGVGMDLGLIMQTSAATSLGLASMRERAELTRGSFSIESAPGEGTTIRAYWPIEADDQLQPGGITQ